MAILHAEHGNELSQFQLLVFRLFEVRPPDKLIASRLQFLFANVQSLLGSKLKDDGEKGRVLLFLHSVLVHSSLSFSPESSEASLWPILEALYHQIR